MTTNYTEQTPVDETVEVRMNWHDGSTYVLVAYRHPDTGTVGHSLNVRGAGVQLSLTNLQSHRIFPRKAVPGWQLEVIAFCEAGLGDVKEIR